MWWACSFRKPTLSFSNNFNLINPTHRLVSSFKPFLRELEQHVFRIDVLKAAVKNTSAKLLDAFVDSTFEFVDYPLDPSQTNAATVDEIKEAAVITNIHGNIPSEFPQGVYIRKGPNPMFGGLKSTKSIFGESSPLWIEGEGMLHALYFSKNINGNWTVVYNNRHVETDTFKLEKLRNKPSFLPVIQGDPLAVCTSFLLNLVRFGKPLKNTSNTNIFEQSGKLFDILTLEALDDWDVNGAWNRSFTAHPKRVPGTGELVTMGIAVTKPFVEVGVISGIIHKLELDRCPLCHEIGVTNRYIVFIMDCPLTIDVNRFIRGGQLIKYESEGNARIGIMPRYGDADSIQWFKVKPNCTFHVINCFEDGDEVGVWGCRALASVVPGPDQGSKKLEWFPTKFKPAPGKPIEDAILEDHLLFPRPYERRLNVQTGDVKERNLTGPNHFPMDFPMINGAFTGLRNKYGYTQVGHCDSSPAPGMERFGGLAKVNFEEENNEVSIKVEYHIFEKNTYCSGAAFDPKEGGVEEDDGWIITFVHHEDTSISEAYIIDTKNFLNEPVTKITLPFRVPYGFHGAFMPIQLQITDSSNLMKLP
ncbi:hypothetical protein ES319_D05G048600v1 [Gossypium barbadense]|uniref:Uncharacterized protein n=1 Tax=Gossypium barbadense TaxID=3634 RepID=A0A5J5RD81_GOSBA|nr:hypothetical protein ES319_D05G048600v1 [Gossypium barbadense]